MNKKDYFDVISWPVEFTGPIHFISNDKVVAIIDSTERVFGTASTEGSEHVIHSRIK